MKIIHRLLSTNELSEPSPAGKGDRETVDEEIKFCTAQTAISSSVLPIGNPPSPLGKAFCFNR